MESKKEKKVYKVRCTDGSIQEYGYKDMFSLVKDYLEQQGQFPTASDVDRFIPSFIRRMKKVVSDDYTREYDEAHAREAAVAE